jgi:putative thioredoxin
MTAPPPAVETALLTFLNEIGVDHKLHRHVPLFTVEDSKAATAHLPGAHTKNFFLKQKKGGFVLVTCLEDRQIKIKHLEKMIEAKRLSFGSADDLLSVLGVIPGSVTPFAAFNDREAPSVRIILDKQMMEYAVQNFHPLHNAATITVSNAGLRTFFAATGHQPLEVSFDALEDQAAEEKKQLTIAHSGQNALHRTKLTNGAEQMLGMDGGAAAPAADLIKDGTDASFMADVIEASKEAAVIVDFQAEWCGPCKTLGPAIEAAVTQAGGAVKLVKIDIDKNPQFAGQLRVQSIPAVFAFVDGQPVDGFMGNIAPSEVQAFVDKVAALGGGGAAGAAMDEALDMADQMLEEGAAADAAQTYGAILGEEPGNARAVAGLAKAFTAVGQLEEATAALEAAPEEIANDPAIVAAKAQIELAEQAASAGPLDELCAALEADADNHQARLDLATALMASNDTEGAIDELLELFRRDREWNDGAAKAQLFTIFDSLGDKDPVGLKGRRRLSSMIFA